MGSYALVALAFCSLSATALSINRPLSFHTSHRPGGMLAGLYSSPQSSSGACEEPHPEQSSSATSTFIAKYVGDLSVPVVLIASFLNLLGFTMASPIQPALGEHFSLPMGASFGSLSSAYPLGMMFGVFIWPALSDVVGRKIVMAMTLFGSGMGLFLQSWAVNKHWTLEQFLATRVVTGCFAGNSPICKAYLADKGSEGNRKDLTKFLAWKDASSTLAFIVGPLLGGLLYTGGKNAADNTGALSFVIRFSAMSSILASLAVSLFVKDKPRKKDSTGQSLDEDKNYPKEKSSEIISCPLGTKLWTGVATVAAVSTLYHAADSTFFAFFPSLLKQKLQLNTGSIGMAFTSFAFLSFSMSAFVSSRFIRTYGPVAACSTGLGTIATALFCLSYAASHSEGIRTDLTSRVILAAASLYYIGVPLYGPTVPTMLLQCVPPHRRGAVMGFDGTVNTVARVMSPLIMGEVHRRKGASACFRVAGSFVCVASSLALLRRWLVLRKDFAASQTGSNS